MNVRKFLVLASLSLVLGWLCFFVFMRDDLIKKNAEVSKFEKVSKNKSILSKKNKINRHDRVLSENHEIGTRFVSSQIETPRGKDEWPGLRIKPEDPKPPCIESSRCGLARACLNGKCIGCSLDHDCAESEVCVLQHCVLEENTKCTSRSQCGKDEYCVLSGYSSDARGNENMLAFCQSLDGGLPDSSPRTFQVPGERQEPPVKYEDLLERVRSL